MKLATSISYSGDFHADVTRIQELEKAGLDLVWVPEAYSFDAISQVGFLAAKTERVEIGTGIINVFSRTATAIAQTARRVRLRQRRPVRARSRRIGATGHRGVPRRAVRAPDAAASASTSTSAGWCGAASRSSTTARSYRSRCRPGRAPGWASRSS